MAFFEATRPNQYPRRTQAGHGLYYEGDGHGMGRTYVRLDIFSIPQFHYGRKLFAVNSVCVYATAADAAIIPQKQLIDSRLP